MIQRSRMTRNFVGQSEEEATKPGARPHAVSMCFGRVRAFLRIVSDSGALSDKEWQEYAVVDLYEPVPIVELDQVDVALGCIKLRWAVKNQGSGPTRWVDLVPVKALRARVHVIPAPRIETDETSELHWTDETFCVNRFKLSNYEATFNRAGADLVSSSNLQDAP